LIVNAKVPVPPLLSTTETVNGNEPAASGVPVIAPLAESKAKPSGSCPAEIAHA
jgi:hypothetical protein